MGFHTILMVHRTMREPLIARTNTRYCGSRSEYTCRFPAQLNRVAVTGSFQPTGNGDERVAIFDLADSPIVVGRNVLVTSVEGIVPGTARTASDGDAFTFFID